MAAEVASRGRPQLSDGESDGVPEVSQFADVADSTVAAQKRRQTTRPKEGMYEPIASEISPEPKPKY